MENFPTGLELKKFSMSCFLVALMAAQTITQSKVFGEDVRVDLSINTVLPPKCQLNRKEGRKIQKIPRETRIDQICTVLS